MNSPAQPAPAQRRSVYPNYRPAAEAPIEPASPAATPVSSPLQPAPDAFAPLQDAIDSAVARAFAHQFLARCYEYPDRTSWEWLCGEPVHQMLRASFAEIDIDNTAGSDARIDGELESLLEQFKPEGFEPFQQAYIAAFGHSARGDCPINEVEYGDIKADPLFQPHRLADLGAFYSAFGLELSGEASERLDHICCELEFMAVLAAKEAYALEQQAEDEQLALCRDAQKKFVREHLGRWVPAFTRRLEQLVGENVLGVLARVTRGLVLDECRRAGISPGGDDLLLRPVDEAAERACASCGMASPPPGAL
jgi:putative dimethyl sulfoxide reductase chaperone